mmetsp:Transcript_6673/g.25145  ORF Transcript_6673/g.25145 Transcript_6673/m.25145 type:complete len:331 (-) Transcript_6673:1474-2466(-)
MCASANSATKSDATFKSVDATADVTSTFVVFSLMFFSKSSFGSLPCCAKPPVATPSNLLAVTRRGYLELTVRNDETFSVPVSISEKAKEILSRPVAGDGAFGSATPFLSSNPTGRITPPTRPSVGSTVNGNPCWVDSTKHRRKRLAPSLGNTNQRASFAVFAVIRKPLFCVSVVFLDSVPVPLSPPASSYANLPSPSSSSSRVPLDSISCSLESSSSWIAGTRSCCLPSFCFPEALETTCPHCSRSASPSANCLSNRTSRAASLAALTGSNLRDISFSVSASATDSPPSFMCASHLRSGNDRSLDLCLHSPVLTSSRYRVNNRQPWFATA